MTDGQTDRETDESEFIGRCPTNLERPIKFVLAICICNIFKKGKCEFLTVSVVRRRIFVPLNRYGYPKIEPNFSRTRFVKIPYGRLGNARDILIFKF